MSFVSIISRKNFITVMSDGQVTNHEGQPIQSDFQKFKQISPHQFIAFAGAKEICEQFINQVEYTAGSYNLNDIANQINQIANEERFNQFRLFFAIGGIELDGDITLYVVEHGGTRDFRVQRPINEDDINYAFLNSEMIDRVNMNEKLIECLRITGFETPEECLYSQKLLNDFVESIDSTVNNQTFTLIIRKSS
ncbi:hypothetical protein MKY20_19980 [Cytobacillus sp. FSL W8-0315]|uniref:hypothetical protein n=1 Tax=Cytobacillus sp. FSL W8-0315 TaxID=2921600 RepID=UPI0030F9D8C6